MEGKFKKNCILFLFFMGIVILTVGGVWFYAQLRPVLHFEKDIQESYQTIRAANQAQIAIYEAELDVNRFSNTSDSNSLGNLPRLMISAQINLAALNQLTQDEPDEINKNQEIKVMFDKKLDFLNKIVTQYNAGDKAAALQTASDKSSLELAKQITQKIIEIRHIEILQLENAKDAFRSGLRQAKVIYLATGIICEVLFLISYIVLRRFFK